MEKLLVMGSNFGAVELVKRAKERGIYTIVTDNYDVSRSNAKRYCDECWDVSITETDLLAEMCLKGGVTAITCGVSEFTSELTFKLCDRLGLPKYCTWDAWSVARDKRAFKDLCTAHGVPVARDYCIGDPTDLSQVANVEFPVVVKPVDCGGNCGVTFCHDVRQLALAFDKARAETSHPDTIICERMLHGTEYAAVYALAEGEASLVCLFSMLHGSEAPTYCYSLDVLPTGVLDKYLSEVDSGIREVFEEAGFTDGLAWVEFILDEDGSFYALEPGYRMPGGMIIHTFESVVGFNAIDWYLDAFLGERHVASQLPPPQSREPDTYGVSYLLWSSVGGTLWRVEGLDEIEADGDYLLVDFIRRPGYELSPYSLMGEIIFTAADRAEALRKVERINETVRMINADGENVLIYFDDLDKIH